MQTLYMPMAFICACARNLIFYEFGLQESQLGTHISFSCDASDRFIHGNFAADKPHQVCNQLFICTSVRLINMGSVARDIDSV
jgi:hypothetical protein